ncbi:TadG family pilus assembly protein [Devosia algicola]|uniref:TadG family pilus assembly protein n=1 Tax=Devosia algicola TaxID=3026418 RepID=A0ABY7YM26_9HYPH|nr:TadG family pilus assembly protein [Devosia algicola]WDR01995.1 TadG family pilus assembly protein [Devosia algicola]
MAILFAVALSISAVVSAFAVDAASLYNERRVMQSNVDLAALAAARDPDNALKIAGDTLAEAGLIAANTTAPGVRLHVDVGHYEPDPDRTPERRFVVGQTPVNAVRIHLERPGEPVFCQIMEPDTGAGCVSYCPHHAAGEPFPSARGWRVCRGAGQWGSQCPAGHKCIAQPGRL